MTDERLYIDGVLVDMGTNTKITLDVKSNLFRDISKIVSNNTYTVKLPKTVRNQMVLEHTDLVQSRGDYPYKRHTARYFRNGVEVIKDGIVSVLSVSNEAIEVCIVWGLYPNFSELISKGTSLNQLTSDARILWTGNDSADTYADALTKDYFYADMNVWTNEEISEYWNEGNSPNAPESGSAPGRFGNGSRTWGTGIFMGRRGSNKSYLHPSVKVSWVLGLIKKNTGIDFKFSGDAKNFLDSLIIPLINNKATELTFNETFSATLPAISGTTFGSINPTVKNGSNIFKETTGEVSQLTIIADAKVYVNIQCEADYDLRNWKFKGSRGWRFNGCFVMMTLTGSDGTVKGIYTAGQARGGPGTNGNRTANYSDYPSGIYQDYLTGTGVVEMEAGDTLTFGLRYCCFNGFGGHNINSSEYYKATTPQGANPPTTFKGGTIEISATGSDDTVPVGGYYPIAYNLPNIKIIDFVKFLAAITGTFPKQLSNDGEVEFIPFSTIWDNKAKAKDWTRRVLPQGGENKPKELDFNVSDYAQHNMYRWKEDDTVTGNYDGDLTVDNKSLDASRDVMTFPFAATDGAYVPMYTKGEDTTNSDGTTTEGKPSFKACKDRILQLADDEDGKAVGVFSINMQDILNDAYKDISNTLHNTKVVKETMRIRDIELLNFDETVPIYLAQYGSYFAINEIKSEASGLAEVEMLKLEIRD